MIVTWILLTDQELYVGGHQPVIGELCLEKNLQLVRGWGEH